ncbi:MAG: AbrB/MazE/SpoVT family DNA-binding domain-containing protein [Bryobacterales bacterium]|nr:AbrB/MazE/SpoVT family DNA-binding domain-containing protein [Bryobacterales bacterium]
MTLKIDRAGCVVLPKPVRDRHGLKEGTDLEVQETAKGVVLKPVQQRASLVTRDGLLIRRGKLPRGYDWSRLIEDDREDRMWKLAEQ